MVSHVKSKLGSVSGSTGEGAGELDPDITTPPVWGIVPDGAAQQGTLYEIPMTTWVTGRGLTGWLLAGNPAGVTINSLGIVTILDTVPDQVLSMTCYVENVAGNDTSNTFEWELEAVHIPEPPVWDVVPPQSTPDSNLPDQLDMTDFVTSFLPITAWTTTEGTITNEGILVIPLGTPVGTLSITVTAENADGVAPSAPFDWEITLSGDEPEWGTVPDRAIEIDDLPYQEDMNDHIIAGAGLTGWALSGNPAGIIIDGAGLMTMAMGTPIGEYTMTCFVENQFGDDTSNSFTWSVIEIIPPVWDDIPEQENDDRDHPVDLDMTQFVSSDSPLTGWTTDVGAIDGVGLLTVPFISYDTIPITVGVTNDGGTEEVTFDWLAIVTSPDIDTQPLPLEVDEPDGGQFTIEASHPVASVQYSWWANTGSGWIVADDILSDVLEGSQITDTLVLSSTIESDNGLVRCRVRAANDSGTQVISDEVALTVNPLGPPVWDDPIPNDEIDIADMPYERDMSAFVTVDPLVPITAYTTDVGAIDNTGALIVFGSEGVGTHPITVFATNERGSVPGSFTLNITDESFEGYHHDFNADLGGFSFTRASSQWGIAEDGIFYESIENEPVYPGCANDGNGNWIPNVDFEGLLFEGVGNPTNPEPVNFDTSGNYSTQNTTQELDVEPSPINGFLAAEIIETTSTSQHEMRLNNLVIEDDNQPTSQYLIVKPAGRDYHKNQQAALDHGTISRFSLPDVEVTNQSGNADFSRADDLGNGWVGIGQGELDSGVGAPGTAASRWGFLDSYDGSDNYEGDGVSGGRIALWQVESHPFPTSPMINGPRALSNCTQSPAAMIGFNPFNDFAIRVIFKQPTDRALYQGTGIRYVLSIAGGGSDQVRLVYPDNNNNIQLQKNVNGIDNVNLDVDISNKLSGEEIEAVLVVSSISGLQLYIDGELEAEDPLATANFPVALNTFALGRSGGSDTQYMTIKSLTMITGEAADIGPITITQHPDDLEVTEPTGGQFEFDYTFDAAGGVIDRLWEWSANGVDGWTQADEIMSNVSDVEELIMLVNSTVVPDTGFVRAWATYRGHPEHLVITNVAELIVNTAPPVWDTQPDDEEFSEGSLPQNIPMALHVTGADGGWQIDSSNTNLQINAGSGVVTAQPALPVGVHTATVTANNDGGSADSDEFTVTIISELNPPEWGPDIPNQTTEVLDMPATFDANDFVSSGEAISGWTTVQGASSVNGSGVVSLPRRGVGSLNNDAVNASNSAGTTQSNTFNWIINPSVVIDDDFSTFNTGDLEGQSVWEVLPREGQDPAPSHTITADGRAINGPELGAFDRTGPIPAGDFEFEFQVSKRPNQIIEELQDTYNIGWSTVDDPETPEDLVGAFIRVFESAVWYQDGRGNEFRLTGANAANDTYGMVKVGTAVTCFKNGAEVGTFTSVIDNIPGVMIMILLGLGNSSDLGIFNISYAVTG